MHCGLSVGGFVGEAFESVARRALGCEPWPWQVRLAEDGLPELLEVPTGCGKTAGVVLAWLYRRRFHPDEAVRAATPRRMVFVLPMRTLVEQTRDVVQGWLARLGLDDADGVRTAVLMGGERSDDDWRLDLAEDAIVIGTLDMILSRALNRGYGQSRYAWPIDFGLLNNDCAYVLDEVQLMGAARPTSRQLQAFRDRYGTTATVTSTWMSATLDPNLLHTVDAPTTAEPFTLRPGAASPDLRQRLEAVRTIERWDDRARADVVAREHRAGTLTLVIVNTVRSARTLYDELGKLGLDADVVLLHSRFRPPDRAKVLSSVLAPPPPAGRIVCTTQVVEAGVDISATTLFTEAAPWSSIVQRIGRCNRDGEADDARVLWGDPTAPEPYDAEDVAAARAQLEKLTGSGITTESLSALEVAESGGEESQVVRRTDLLRLFDTAPDLSGNDLDIAPFIRDGQDLDVQLAWRTDLATDRDGQYEPHRDELCPVGVAELRVWRRKKQLFRLNHLARPGQDRWILLANDERLVPGQVLLVDAKAGGYTPELGWAPNSTGPVAPIGPMPRAGHDPEPQDGQLTADGGTTIGAWIPLDQHLDDVGAEAASLLRQLGYGLPEAIANSVAAAARWHDWGKAHPVFQHRLAVTGERPDAAALWAKSAGSKRRFPANDRRYFRHELASALAILSASDDALSEALDRNLTAYLAAAHHGKVRMSIRAAPDELGPDDDRRFALGVWDGDELPAVTAGGDTMPATRLDLSPMDLGGIGQGPSWVALTSALLERGDLGPFRLAFLEALVRMADWRASASYNRMEADR